jgi:DNA-binding CsgD family transcriptional regulator
MASSDSLYLHHGNFETLSKREREILKMIGQGRSSKEISVELRLSKETIGSYRRDICRKLGVHSTAELIAYAIRVFQ